MLAPTPGPRGAAATTTGTGTTAITNTGTTAATTTGTTAATTITTTTTAQQLLVVLQEPELLQHNFTRH